MFTLRVKMIASAFLLAINCCVGANEPNPANTPASNKSIGIEKCQQTIGEYAKWRSRALAIYSRDTFKEEVVNWLKDGGFDQTSSKNIFSGYIQIEAQMQSIDGVYVECGYGESLNKSGVEGTVLVKYTNQDGKIGVSVFSDKVEGRYAIRNKKEHMNLDEWPNPSFDFEPVPASFHDDVESHDSTYQREIDEALGAKPTDLVFENSEVDLFFDWPENTLVKLTENFSRKIVRNGKTITNFSLRKRQARIEPDENGLRISFLADGSELYSGKSQPPEVPNLQHIIDGCLNHERLCLLSVPLAKPRPFTIDVFGKVLSPVHDVKHSKEILRGIDIHLADLHNVDLYREKVSNLLDQSNEEQSYVNLQTSNFPPIHYSKLHATNWKLDEVVNNFLLADFRDSDYKPVSLRSVSEVSYVVSYKGKVACNEVDQSDSCIKLVSIADINNLPKSSWAKNTTTLIIEPHTLLPHSIRSVSDSTEYELDDESIDTRGSVDVHITMDYE